MWIFNFRNKNYWGIWDFNEIFGNFQTSLAQFLEGVRMIQRYHDVRTDVLVLSAKSGRNLRFQWRFWNFVFFQRISTKIETKSHFQKFWVFLAENHILSKIPFYLEKPSKVWKADNPILSRSHFIGNVLYRGLAIKWEFAKMGFLT